MRGLSPRNPGDAEEPPSAGRSGFSPQTDAEEEGEAVEVELPEEDFRSLVELTQRLAVATPDPDLPQLETLFEEPFFADALTVNALAKRRNAPRVFSVLLGPGDLQLAERLRNTFLEACRSLAECAAVWRFYRSLRNQR
jgi:hypothetical protein